jgi:UDP-N-acetylglucosamine--N-acetylmuramyl-(pentapeptide) pyrophosphoryl-undecaprenol N-acetylglucosamine transferase
MEKYFPSGKIIITGNPVRTTSGSIFITKTSIISYQPDVREKKTLLVLGGSLGARTINEALLRCYEKLLQSEIQIIWQQADTISADGKISVIHFLPGFS